MDGKKTLSCPWILWCCSHLRFEIRDCSYLHTSGALLDYWHRIRPSAGTVLRLTSACHSGPSFRDRAARCRITPSFAGVVYYSLVDTPPLVKTTGSPTDRQIDKKKRSRFSFIGRYSRKSAWIPKKQVRPADRNPELDDHSLIRSINSDV